MLRKAETGKLFLDDKLDALQLKHNEKPYDGLVRSCTNGKQYFQN